MVSRLPKMLIVFFILSCMHYSCMGQNTYSDSLKRELKKNIPDSNRIKILLILGDRESYRDKQQALRYLKQAYSLSNLVKNNAKMAEALAYLGSVFYYSDQYDSALRYFNQSIAFFKKEETLDAKLSISTVKSEIADVMVLKDQYEPAIKIYLESSDLLLKYDSANYNAIGNTYLATAKVYKDMEQYPQALAYTEKAISQLKKDTKKPAALAFAELFKATNLVSLSKTDEAESALKEASVLAEKVNSHSLFSQLYGNWAAYYSRKKDFRNAILFYQKALSSAQKDNNSYSQASALIQLGLIYANGQIRDYSSSQKFLLQALQILSAIGDEHRKAKVLHGLANAEAALHHHRDAVKYYQQYIHLSDSLNEFDVKKKINEIENKYQAQKKQEHIVALQKNNDLQKAQLKQKNTVNIALVAGCVLLLLIALLFYKNFKNKNRLLIQKEKLHEQRIREMQKERKLEAAENVMKGQEEERSRLAKDLHDGVGGLLSGVKLSMSNMKGNVFLSEENVQAFNNVIVQLDQSITELRRVSHNMMPEALIKFGLKEALENYCENLNHAGKMTVQLQTYGMEKRMKETYEIVIYRMIQELLNNIIKHADAKNVLIQLIRKEDRFTLTVEDDGKGFDQKEIEKNPGAGLANIRARTEYLNGNIDIISSKSEGTSVTIEGNCA